ncbi:hypothetical protein Q9L58_008545 [Maublancomyces gigas]|uniref:Uncharacterized protein n=1 Tax=Discina gigas TaxID=1032678 RepID=A0ABR3G9M8_9PEZI
MSFPSNSLPLPVGENLHSPPASAPSSPPSTHVTYPALPQLQPQWSDPHYVYSYTLHSELVKPTKPTSSGTEGFFGLSDISRANCGAKDATYRVTGKTTTSSDRNSGPIGYGVADDMSSRVKRYYRNSFPKAPEEPASLGMAEGLIAAGLRFDVDSGTASVSKSSSSSEAAKVERYYRNRVIREPAVPESGIEAAGWVSLDSETALVSPVEMTSEAASSEGSMSTSTSTSQSSTTSTSRSTSPAPSLRSAEDKQPEMAEKTSDEKACSVC